MDPCEGWGLGLEVGLGLAHASQQPCHSPAGEREKEGRALERHRQPSFPLDHSLITQLAWLWSFTPSAGCGTDFSSRSREGNALAPTVQWAKDSGVCSKSLPVKLFRLSLRDKGQLAVTSWAKRVSTGVHKTPMNTLDFRQLLLPCLLSGDPDYPVHCIWLEQWNSPRVFHFQSPHWQKAAAAGFLAAKPALNCQGGVSGFQLKTPETS